MHKLRTPLKTNMTMENHHFKMYFLLRMGIFQCHVGFPGCYFGPKNPWKNTRVFRGSCPFFGRVWKYHQ